MIKKLIHDPIFLAGKSENAAAADLPIAQDLLDTLAAHRNTCVGMAANMIGIKKRIIAFLDESGPVSVYTILLNPEILQKSGAYETEESCLSLLGGPRPCRRYRTIRVRYLGPDQKVHTKTYTGFTAQIVQHEMDHLDGVLI